MFSKDMGEGTGYGRLEYNLTRGLTFLKADIYDNTLSRIQHVSDWYFGICVL